MSDTPKRSGADCPNCKDPWPAEYAQKDQEPRWSCVCGAGGPLSGAFARRTPAVQQSAPSRVKPHWSGR